LLVCAFVFACHSEAQRRNLLLPLSLSVLAVILSAAKDPDEARTTQTARTFSQQACPTLDNKSPE
jgi:hypothetical protein